MEPIQSSDLMLRIEKMGVTYPGNVLALRPTTVDFHKGEFTVLLGLSGAGKSTLARRLRAWDPSIIFSVSATTRAPRPGEVDGQDYHFMSLPDFKRALCAGEMLDWEAPTGGYLLTGCLATGQAAGRGVLRYLGI